MDKQKPLDVFISYSWKENEPQNIPDLVMQLAENLDNIPNITCEIDKHEKKSHDMDWPLWMEKRIIDSDIILVVCTKNYYDCYYDYNDCLGEGVKYETPIIRSIIKKKKKIIYTVIFDENDAEFIPIRLDSIDGFNLSKQEFNNSCKNYKGLIDKLLQNLNKDELNENLLSLEQKQNRYHLFEKRMFVEANIEFKEAIKIDPDNEKDILHYIISSISNIEIDSLTEKNIDDLYDKIELIDKGKYSDIAIYLWLILYKEFSTIRSPKLDLDDKVIEKTSHLLKKKMTQEEKQLLSNIDFQTNIGIKLGVKEEDQSSLTRNKDNVDNQVSNEDYSDYKFTLSDESSKIEHYECFDDMSSLKLGDGKELLKITDKIQRQRWLFFYRPYNDKGKITSIQNKTIKQKQEEIAYNEYLIQENDKIFMLTIIMGIFATIFVNYLDLGSKLYYLSIGIPFIHCFVLNRSNNKYKILNKQKEEVVDILNKEKEHLINQQKKYLKIINAKKIEEQFWQDLIELEYDYIERILKKNPTGITDENFYKNLLKNIPKEYHLKFPVIPSWALLQESEKDNKNTGINLAYNDIGNKISTWRKLDNDKLFFRLWYIQFLFFTKKNLILISFYYDFVKKKKYDEHIELYHYDHITNYSYSNLDMSFMKDDKMIKKINLPKELQIEIFGTESKTVSLESASGSHHKCVIPDKSIFSKINNWIEIKKDNIDSENDRHLDDLENEKINNIDKTSFSEDIAWATFEKLKQKVENSKETHTVGG